MSSTLIQRSRASAHLAFTGHSVPRRILNGHTEPYRACATQIGLILIIINAIFSHKGSPSDIYPTHSKSPKESASSFKSHFWTTLIGNHRSHHHLLQRTHFVDRQSNNSVNYTPTMLAISISYGMAPKPNGETKPKKRQNKKTLSF